MYLNNVDAILMMKLQRMIELAMLINHPVNLYSFTIDMNNLRVRTRSRSVIVHKHGYCNNPIKVHWLIIENNLFRPEG